MTTYIDGISVSLSVADADELISSADFQSVSEVLDERMSDVAEKWAVQDAYEEYWEDSSEQDWDKDMEVLEQLEQEMDSATTKEEWMESASIYSDWYKDVWGTRPRFLTCPFQ